MEKSIINLVPAYFPYETGFSTAFQNLEKALISEKCVDKVYVIAPHDSENPRIPGIEYSKLKKWRYEKIIKGLFWIGFPQKLCLFLYKIKFREIKKLIRKVLASSDVQVILVESMFLAWCVPLIRKQFDVPVMVRIHGTGPEVTKYIHNKRTNMYKAFLNWTFASKYVSATTSFYFDFFQEYWNDYSRFMNKYFFIIPNTTDFEKKEITKKNEIVFLQLGRMDSQGYHQKGFTDTVQALLYLEEIMDIRLLSKITYITIGNGENEEEFIKILSSLKHINTKHYSQLSNIDVKTKIMESDVIIIPSRCEGMSMFATEALAIGRAFVYTKNNGLRSMIFDGENGIAVNAYDYLEMAKAIKSFIERPEIISQYGNKSREIFEREFSYKRVSDKFKVVLNTVDSTK